MTVPLNPLAPFSSLFPENRLPELPDKLKNWWQESPFIADARASPIPGLAPLPQEINVSRLGKIEQKYEKTRKKWAPNIAFPAIFFGVFFTLAGTSACITILSGIEIPGMGFVLKNVPVSLAFSLSLVRGGIAAINTGINKSRQTNRLRQDHSLAYHNFLIRDAIERLTPEEREKQSKEILLLDKTLKPTLSIAFALGRTNLYGKENEDIPSRAADPFLANIHSILNRPRLQQPNAQPAVRELPEEVILKKPQKGQKPSGFMTGIYDYFYKKQTSLGVYNMFVGQLMFVAAIVSLVFLFFPSMLPSGLDVFINDPYLSLPFSFILLGNWISCTRIGWRMLDFNKREAKRKQIEQDLQLINLGIEKWRVEAYCAWLTSELTKLENAHPQHRNQFVQCKAEIRQCLEQFNNQLVQEYGKEIKAALKARSKENPKGCCAPGFHKLGKSMVPSLATPSILIGCIVLFMGFACLGMAITGTIPEAFVLLTKNTSLSIIFAASLLVTGFNSIYRGASLSDFNDKQSQKNKGVEDRQELIGKLFNGPKKVSRDQFEESMKRYFLEPRPSLAQPTTTNSSSPAKKAVDANMTVSENNKKTAEKIRENLEDYQRNLINRKGWYGFWILRTQKWYFWGPQALLGGFLFVVSVWGLLVIAGLVDPSSFLNFIVKEPSAAATFFFSLLVMGVDAIISSHRIATYNKRKVLDRKDLNVIKQCHDALFPPNLATAIRG